MATDTDWTTRVAAAIATAVVMSLATGHKAAAEDGATLVFHVTNFADVPADDLARAEAETTRVYQDIGVRTRWTNTNDTTASADGARHMAILILAHEMADRLIDRIHADTDVLGIAPSGTSRAYIFRDRIAQLAVRKMRNGNTLLGKVIAHEVGHLLLPGNGHSPTGIMRGGLEVEPTSQRFTREQADIIRKGLAASVVTTIAR